MVFVVTFLTLGISIPEYVRWNTYRLEKIGSGVRYIDRKQWSYVELLDRIIK